LPRAVSSEVFAHLNADDQNDLLAQLTSEETRHLLAGLSPDDRTQLLEELPGQVTQKLLTLLGPEDLREARQLLGYPEESVGRLMTPDYVAVRPEWTIARALEHIRSRGPDSETINMVYVTDEHWRFRDALELRRFILADPQQTVAEIMDYAYVVLSAFDDREKAVQALRRYDLPALPVVDSGGVLLGIVTFDDLIDVADKEATEDFHKGAAVAPLRGKYLETRIIELVQKRAPWLLALVFVNIFIRRGHRRLRKHHCRSCCPGLLSAPADRQQRQRRLPVGNVDRARPGYGRSAGTRLDQAAAQRTGRLGHT
jgi:magnesium transporter